MLPTEQTKFFDIVQDALAAYDKRPDQRSLESWWRECKGMTLEALEVALKSHRDDRDRGDRPPRPVDITQRMKVGARDASRCAASDHTGQCQYPGIFSEGTAGDGPWYCPWHRQDHAGPESSRWIERSREIPYEVARAKRVERMTAEGQHAASVTDTAHAIAKRHGDRSWQTGTKFNAPGAGDEN